MISGRLRWALLGAISISSALVWWSSITRLAWLPALYQMPHLDTPKLLGVSSASFDGFARTASAQFVLYFLAWLLARRLSGRAAAVAVICLALPPALVLWLAYPLGAGDVYAYVAEGDLVLRYGANPFYVPAGQVPDNPLLPFLDFPDETTHYGPLWIAVEVMLRWASGGNLLAAVLLFKAASIIFLAITAFATFEACQQSRGRDAVSVALLVAWNPLMLFEFAGNGHNDVAMSALVACAFYLQARNRRRAAIFALAAGCLVKYVAVVLGPIFLLTNLRGAGPLRQWLPRTLLDATGLGALGLLLSLLVGTDGTLGILQRMTTWFTTSPGAVLYYHLSQTMPGPDATAWVGNATRAVFCACYLGIACCLWRGWFGLVVASTLSLIAFMFVETVWFQPWYVAWVLPTAALIAGEAGTGLVLGLTAGGLGVHLVMGFGFRLWWFAEEKAILHARGVAAMWVPVVVAFGGARAASFLMASRRRPVLAGPDPVANLDSRRR